MFSISTSYCKVFFQAALLAALIFACAVLSGCGAALTVDAETGRDEPLPVETPAHTNTPVPTAAAVPSPTPTQAPAFPESDLEKLDQELAVLIGLFKMDEARALVGRAKAEGLANSDVEARESRIDASEAFQKNNLAHYDGPIEHLFTHCLIAFPEICYSGNKMTASLDNDCITPSELKKILQSLYENNYILIDANIMLEETESGNAALAQLYLPEGKKPLIFSVDDVTYDSRKMHTGMVDKLIAGEGGAVWAYTVDEDGDEIISRDNEVFPIIDDFVTQHPDFSFRGAKGTLCLTGFDGILGYRTMAKNLEDREDERARAMEVVSALKNYGWSFGSHSYGHGHMNTKMSYENVKNDALQWEEEVASLVGETRLFFYPYGESVYYTDAKHEFLYDMGFRLFCGVMWKSPSLQELPGNAGVLQTRRNLDGYTLRNSREAFAELFDTDEVIDPIRG